MIFMFRGKVVEAESQPRNFCSSLEINKHYAILTYKYYTTYTLNIKQI